MFYVNIWKKEFGLKPQNLRKGNTFSDKSVITFDVGNKFNNSSGTVRLEFSYLGKVKGYSGSGFLVIIKAEVLKEKFLFSEKDKKWKGLSDNIIA